MRMVPIDAYHKIRPAHLQWMVDACGGPVAFWCDVWRVADGGWRVYTLQDGELAVEDTRIAVLVRSGGVRRCVNFGTELELMGQVLSENLEKWVTGVAPIDDLQLCAGGQVFFWNEVGTPIVLKRTRAHISM